MNSEMTTHSQLSTTKLKNKNKLSKQVEQEQNNRNGDHVEGYQQGGVGENGVQGIRIINDRYKIDRGRLRVIQKIEKPKNLYVQAMDMN